MNNLKVVEQKRTIIKQRKTINPEQKTNFLLTDSRWVAEIAWIYGDYKKHKFMKFMKSAD
jgi:hypothetical protein